MKVYDTVTEAIQDLNNKGFSEEFDLKSDCIVDVKTDKKFGPEEFNIIDLWRFEGMTNPADNMILYTVKADGKKGTLLESYGKGGVLLNDRMRKRFDIKK